MDTRVSTPLTAQNAMTGFAIAGAAGSAVRKCGPELLPRLALAAVGLSAPEGVVMTSDPHADITTVAARMESVRGANARRWSIEVGIKG